MLRWLPRRAKDLPVSRAGFASSIGAGKNGKPIRFLVRIDGTAPGEDHGVDTDEQGAGIVKEYRLYQLVRQKEKVEDRTFEIEFLDPAVQAFAFTFG
jgi:hypothetical protein